jgi:hypothetical protein
VCVAHVFAQSVNWDVDLQCVASKSPWYLTTGELLMYKVRFCFLSQFVAALTKLCQDRNDPEKFTEFLESMHSGAGAPPHTRAEPALRIMTKVVSVGMWMWMCVLTASVPLV